MAHKEYSFDFHGQQIVGYGCQIAHHDHVFDLMIQNKCQGLPKHIVLKQEDDKHPELFENENKIYHMLKEKGVDQHWTPEYYGVAIFEGRKAIILSYIDGLQLEDEKMPSIDTEQLKGMLQPPLRAIRALGIVHEDTSMKNVIYSRDKFVIVDFEMTLVTDDNSKEAVEDDVEFQLDALLSDYERRQKAIRTRPPFSA